MKKSPLTSAQVDLLKWVGILTMMIDHTPKVFHIEGFTGDITTLIGRITFPIFAFLIAHNYHFYSKNPQKYIRRLMIWGFIAQPIYMYALDKPSFNILFVLAAGLLLQKSMDDYSHKKNKQTINTLVFGFVFAFFVGLFSGYGMVGVLLIPAFCLWIRQQDIYQFIILATIILSVNKFTGNAVMGLGVVLLLFCLPKKQLFPRMAGWFFYFFYPAHLALLALLNKIFFV
jgi:hypothetical protein